ncbi:thiamine phosphate synthase [Terrihabitans rhizophilus]|uniref:Thiamine phosphate synthase n=1 Tax=Terrihabitans rhizophilus TaxID=3092662 RepID=A0ABU4RRA9_9HYPH|nr:thiamine phosphate synthase [Terrihabitans sp. PJ23]MDX6806703.1 thiamine phosphate synthase [Terrihabitans sp. PJ23]
MSKTSQKGDAARLMLISPVLQPDADFEGALAAALEAAEISAVVLRVEPGGDERGLLKVLKPLVELAQERGAAVLVEGAPDLVGKSGADGIHALGEKQAVEATERFRPEKIVGVGGLRTRDTAMSVGEIGADYVLFGDPGKGGEAPPLDALLDRLAWWAEVFVIPCVGYAAAPDAVSRIAATGAEFVALGPWVWTHDEGPGAAVSGAVDALALGEAV